MIEVLVVDDDFHVAEINAAYVSKVPGFHVAGRAHSAAPALAAIERGGIDLVLLDQYLPDMSGLSLTRRLRQRNHDVDVIMVTADRSTTSVRAALRVGVLQYLVKPFDSSGLAAKLKAYAQLRAALGHGEAGQEEVDRIFGTLRTLTGVTPSSKGYSERTSELIHHVVSCASEPLSAQEVAQHSGVSRSTAQRYLKYLEETGRLRLTLKYGDTGRPEHRYGA
ncbi:response regulator [Streptomyces marokkonensis]|uniref:Transcriptional regulatory protein n=1 Tax=Streptomyces marokkonensis TaxID=324855 RepID=A0ABP7R847_9ACTN